MKPNQASRRLSYCVHDVGSGGGVVDFQGFGFCAMAGSSIFHGRKTDRRPFPGRGINVFAHDDPMSARQGASFPLGQVKVRIQAQRRHMPTPPIGDQVSVDSGRLVLQNKVLTSSICIDVHVTQHAVGVSVTDNNNNNGTTPDHASSVGSVIPSFLPRLGNQLL